MFIVGKNVFNHVRNFIVLLLQLTSTHIFASITIYNAVVFSTVEDILFCFYF